MSHSTSPTQAVLLLEDGSVHYGKAFGKRGTTSGEICFNTGMTGYQEVFTDPSYYGQVLIMNSVHIGNYGVKDSDVESSGVKIRGLIGRNLEEQFSRIQAKGSLDDYMKANNIVCIEEVDTRSLVAHVRRHELRHFFRDHRYRGVKGHPGGHPIHGWTGAGLGRQHG